MEEKAHLLRHLAIVCLALLSPKAVFTTADKSISIESFDCSHLDGYYAPDGY